MKKSLEQFKRMSLLDQVIIVCALASTAGYLINAIKR